MGAGPPRLLLERIGGQRATEGHHGRVVRSGSAVRPNPSRQQPHCGLYAGDRPGSLYYPAAWNLRVDFGKLLEKATAPLVGAVAFFTRCALYKNLQRKFFTVPTGFTNWEHNKGQGSGRGDCPIPSQHASSSLIPPFVRSCGEFSSDRSGHRLYPSATSHYLPQK